jgi:hypothetical protein
MNGGHAVFTEDGDRVALGHERILRAFEALPPVLPSRDKETTSDAPSDGCFGIKEGKDLTTGEQVD